jgi:hypothetical protein
VSAPNPFAPPTARVADAVVQKPFPQPTLVTRIGMAGPWVGVAAFCIAQGWQYAEHFPLRLSARMIAIYVPIAALFGALAVYAYRNPRLIIAAPTAAMMNFAVAVDLAWLLPRSKMSIPWFSMDFAIAALSLCGLYGVLKMRRTAKLADPI